MKQELEIFFDYACPYCFQAHKYITELIPEYPHINIVWHPCESHPRPDRYEPHSDLCIQGFILFFAEPDSILFNLGENIAKEAIEAFLTMDTINDMHVISCFIRLYECEFICNNQLEDGTWGVPWSWENYQEKWAVSKNWWKANGILTNMLYLKGLEYSTL